MRSENHGRNGTLEATSWREEKARELLSRTEQTMTYWEEVLERKRDELEERIKFRYNSLGLM